MMKQNPSIKPVDPASLRGLSTHAETHWLTFATALKCYAKCPTQPQIRKAAHRHAPSWLRGALRHEQAAARPSERPQELDPETGSLAFLTRDAEVTQQVPPLACDTGRRKAVQSEPATLDPSYQERLERYLSMAAARADVTRHRG